MRRTDDVFFFTLIDFLVQVFFFGLLLFVVMHAEEASDIEANKAREDQVSQVTRWTGFSRLTELTDFLSRLAPPENFRGWADFMSRTKDPRRAEEANKLVAEAGGVDEVRTKLKKYEEAYGLPPCVSDEREGKRVPRAVAMIRLDDTHLEIRRGSPDLEGLLEQLGTTLDEVRRLPLADFRRQFVRLRQLHPECRYFVDVEVRTQFLAPMDALQSAFRIATRR